MNGIFRYKNNQPVNWFNRSLSKSNQYCLYCGSFVGKGSTVESNKEYLVGREFVPTGEFGEGNLFNFIFRACKECNDEKSNVERHVSSVTLFNSPAMRELQAHNQLVCRKAAKDYHPNKKGILVRDSGDNFNIVGASGGINMTFGISGPPQVDPRYIKLLAFRHIQGVFSLITSRDPLVAEGTNLLISNYFHFFGSYNYADWGNPHLVAIMNRAYKIPCYANIVTANGFFRAIMRRSSGDKGEWFWALEWNKSYRLVGAIAQPDNTPVVFRDLPSMNWKDLGVQNGIPTRIREEVPLEDEQDLLFAAEVEGTKSA